MWKLISFTSEKSEFRFLVGNHCFFFGPPEDVQCRNGGGFVLLLKKNERYRQRLPHFHVSTCSQVPTPPSVPSKQLSKIKLVTIKNKNFRTIHSPASSARWAPKTFRSAQTWKLVTLGKDFRKVTCSTVPYGTVFTSSKVTCARENLTEIPTFSKKVWKRDDCDTISQKVNKNVLKQLKGDRQNRLKKFRWAPKCTFPPNQHFPFSI